jgi:hypothetical protein
MGFQLDKRWRYLVFAILAHGLVDTLIPMAGKFGWGVLQLEGMVAGVAGVAVGLRFLLKKVLSKERCLCLRIECTNQSQFCFFVCSA